MQIQSGHAVKLLICSERANHFEDSNIVGLINDPRIASVTFSRNLVEALQAMQHYDVCLLLPIGSMR